MLYVDGYNVEGLKGQIMTFQESRKTKNIKDITLLIFRQSIWLKYHLFYFVKWNLKPFNLFQIEQAFKVL
jgi:hypothetical protein